MHDIAAAWVIGGFLLLHKDSGVLGFFGFIIIAIATLIGTFSSDLGLQITSSLP